MKFYWTAVIVTVSSTLGLLGVGLLFKDHISDTVVGFFVGLSVFVAGVEHLSDKMDKIIGSDE